jgi:hypothetical protein
MVKKRAVKSTSRGIDLSIDRSIDLFETVMAASKEYQKKKSEEASIGTAGRSPASVFE